ncbi:hypothetical protein WJX74_005816 [Apatococcus lobatus]|uniref:Fe2OG dioxygenase domain-containing protein n=1 Tax=Apatococcus lobatus TaxID=904363 RepID=A0AAW1Q2Q9_9CHLO
MQSRLPAFCNPVATHASTWDPATMELSVPLNIQLDGRIVPSPASPDGARVDFSHVIVLDGLFEEKQRAELWDTFIGSAVPSATSSRVQNHAPPEMADQNYCCPISTQQQQRKQQQQPSDRFRRETMGRADPQPSPPMIHGLQTDPAASSNESNNQSLEMPPTDRWERRTADTTGLPGTWGLKPHMLALLARSQVPAAIEVQTRLCRLYPDFLIAHMPTDAIQSAAATSSHDVVNTPLTHDNSPNACGDQHPNLMTDGDNEGEPAVSNSAPAGNHATACHLSSCGAACQQEKQHSMRLQEFVPVDSPKAGDPRHPNTSESCRQAAGSDPESCPADGVAAADNLKQWPELQMNQGLTCLEGPAEPGHQSHPEQLGPNVVSKEQGQVAAAEEHSLKDEELGHCSAFLGNAAVHEDTFQWHVDADPSDFPMPSLWTDVYGHYCNREPGQPLFVSLLLYLDADWPRDYAAETLFLDGDTDVGFAVRPKPCRAILMDQDVLHRVSAPSVLAGQRPRFSLVWKLVFFPRSGSSPCSIARREWGPSASIGSAAKVQQVISSLAGKRKRL